MKVLNSWLGRYIVVFLAASLVVPLGVAQTSPGPQTTAVQSTSAPVPYTVAQTPSPDGPGSTPVQAPSQSSTPQTTQNKQDTSTPPPVGTAAAPYQKQEGVSASKPVGAAIAPGKQRRIRSIAIRVGLLVGAGIAIGVVTAASLGSSSRP